MIPLDVHWAVWKLPAGRGDDQVDDAGGADLPGGGGEGVYLEVEAAGEDRPDREGDRGQGKDDEAGDAALVGDGPVRWRAGHSSANMPMAPSRVPSQPRRLRVSPPGSAVSMSATRMGIMAMTSEA